MTDRVRIFINETPFETTEGTSVRDAVVRFDAALAHKLADGRAYVTDGVGRRITPDDTVARGEIYRVVVSARAAGADREPGA